MGVTKLEDYSFSRVLKRGIFFYENLYMIKLQDLSEENLKRFEKCSQQIIKTMDHYFPELRPSYDGFEARVFMTLYLEMIHMGFFNKKE
jgi:hypothetical protein